MRSNDFHIFILLFLLNPLLAFSQKQYPQNYFSPPLNIPLILSGNFGEIRGNHFHSGLDFKTGNKEGLPVMASASGYVYRIRVSEGGFGKVLYMKHENGYSTVYAHLNSFVKEIADSVLAEQYLKKKFEVEIFPEKDLFYFNKGDTLGLSGNSGGSAGPHLHFEIRETEPDKPLNPLLFGMPVVDSLPPVSKNIFIYDGNRHGNPQVIPLKTLDGTNYFTEEKIELQNTFCLGFEAGDFAATDSNDLGIYTALLTANDDTVYSYWFDSFSFDETKYVIPHTDFTYHYLYGSTVERCFVVPNNKFSVYPEKYTGEIDVNGPVNCRLVLSDYAGHKNEIVFKVERSAAEVKKDTTRARGKLFQWEKLHLITNKNARLQIPAGALFEDVLLPPVTSKRLKIKGVVGNTHLFSAVPVPLSKPATLSFVWPKVSARLKEKLCMVTVDAKNNLSYAGGRYEKGKITGKVNTIGRYAVGIDTIAPSVTGFGFFTDSICNCQKLQIKTGDNLSGIKEYNAYVNGEWTLMEYEPKKSSFFIQISAAPRRSTLMIEATDRKNNKMTWSQELDL